MDDQRVGGVREGRRVCGRRARGGVAYNAHGDSLTACDETTPVRHQGADFHLLAPLVHRRSRDRQSRPVVHARIVQLAPGEPSVHFSALSLASPAAGA
jgi:hypothetical protein